MTHDAEHPESSETPDEGHSWSRRKLVGGAAIGAAVIWTSQFPFAGDAIGQTIGGGPGASGPTGPTGTSGGTGSTGTVPDAGAAAAATGTTGAARTLATTGVDPAALGALGAAAVTAGGAIMWLRSRSETDDLATGTEVDGD